MSMSIDSFIEGMKPSPNILPPGEVYYLPTMRVFGIKGFRRMIMVWVDESVWPITRGDDMIAAFTMANKKNWKHVFLVRDGALGETIEIMNCSQYQLQQRQIRNSHPRVLRGTPLRRPQEWDVPFGL